MAANHDRQRCGAMNCEPFRSCPYVSVVIPVFNRAQLVERAIRSVLNQSYQKFEIILVDDGSTDDLVGTLSKIRSQKLRLISHSRNYGAATARNTGIRKARGQYVAFLDSDDEWLPQKLERQLAFMYSFDARARWSCTASTVVSPDRPAGETRFAKFRITESDMAFGCRISPGSTLMAERSLFDKVGPLCEDLARLEDWDWILRALKTAELPVLNEAVSVIHKHDDQDACYHVVREAAYLMRQKHFATTWLFPSIARLKFISALENELAASAYRDRQYGLALWHFMVSLCYMPYRNLGAIRRIVSTVMRDLFQLRDPVRTRLQQLTVSMLRDVRVFALPRQN